MPAARRRTWRDALQRVDLGPEQQRRVHAGLAEVPVELEHDQAVQARPCGEAALKPLRRQLAAAPGRELRERPPAVGVREAADVARAASSVSASASYASMTSRSSRAANSGRARARTRPSPWRSRSATAPRRRPRPAGAGRSASSRRASARGHPCAGLRRTSTACWVGRWVRRRGFRRSRWRRRDSCDETLLWRGFRRARRSPHDRCDVTHTIDAAFRRTDRVGADSCDETLAIGDERRRNAWPRDDCDEMLAVCGTSHGRVAARSLRRNAHQRCETSHESAPARRVRRNAHTRRRPCLPTQQSS
jgi:hypothetical protein